MSHQSRSHWTLWEAKFWQWAKLRYSPNFVVFKPKGLNLCSGLLWSHCLCSGEQCFLSWLLGDELVVFVLHTTSFWAKYFIFIPQVEANNVLAPLQCFSPSVPNHTLALQRCMLLRRWKKHPNILLPKKAPKTSPHGPGSAPHLL